ncbi:hypothetical protein CISG_08310 [Coccidioides immitis RMSCC 3703]|uniref:Uncharacterized protein n=1 Tax=Coccidioides immitis RMSCC 3703 TaxID=454286 RepID=A0A0J8R5W2_COCIT|nr:hypothetical protein CISG_08310 [Coccidioides immitis RMSCC 3703]
MAGRDIDADAIYSNGDGCVSDRTAKVAEPRPQDQPYPWAPEWIVPSTNLLDADWRQAAMIVANRPNKAVTALLDFAQFSSAVSNQNGKTSTRWTSVSLYRRKITL